MKKIVLLLYFIQFLLLIGCYGDKDSIVENNELASSKCDSLKMKLISLEKHVSELQLDSVRNTSNNVKVISHDPRIVNFVNIFLRDLNNLSSPDGPDGVISHFSEHFYVNGVSLDSANNPHIINADATVFRKRLKAINKRKPFEKVIRNPVIIYEYTDNTFFVVSFKASVKTKYEKSIIYSNVLTTLTGRMGERLLIGNYNWVEMSSLQQ